MNKYFALIIFALANTHIAAQEISKRLVWADDFNGAGMPDTSKWTYDLGKGNPDGYGNNELQFYTNERKNVRIENGLLLIEAHKEKRGEKSYTSTRIKTKGKGDWLYGRFEIKARLPQGRGTWPAIWMLPSKDIYGGWPASGEIDIMEHVGYEPGVIHGTIHTESYNHSKGTQKEGKITIQDAQHSFHIYAVEWDASSMKFFIDDTLYHTVVHDGKEDYKGWPFNHPFHLILNLAVGGNWGGKHGIDDSIWPQKMEIDYVRVYQ